MRTITRTVAGLAAAVPLTLAMLVGCGGGGRPAFPSAPVSRVQTTAAEVIAMPSGFAPVATTCNNGNRVYSAYHGGADDGVGQDQLDPAVAVVPNDPTCRTPAPTPTPSPAPTPAPASLPLPSPSITATLPAASYTSR